MPERKLATADSISMSAEMLMPTAYCKRMVLSNSGSVAVDHELDPPLVTLMIGVGIPLSFLTLPAWWYLLQFF